MFKQSSRIVELTTVPHRLTTTQETPRSLLASWYICHSQGKQTLQWSLDFGLRSASGSIVGNFVVSHHTFGVTGRVLPMALGYLRVQRTTYGWTQLEPYRVSASRKLVCTPQKGSKRTSLPYIQEENKLVGGAKSVLHNVWSWHPIGIIFNGLLDWSLFYLDQCLCLRVSRGNW